MADQAVLKYLSIDTTFDPCYLSLDSTFKCAFMTPAPVRYVCMYVMGTVLNLSCFTLVNDEKI